MKRLAGIVFIAAVAFFGVAASQPATATLHVEGMTCGGCATAVKLVLQKTAGVMTSKVSYEEKQAVVTYDPARTTPAKIAAAVADALSYKVTVADANPRLAAPAAAIAASSCAAPNGAEASSKPIALPSYRLDALRTAFNNASNQVRVMALLSPTCGECQKGQRVVQSVFTKYPNDARLRGFVVWLPMLASDSERAASAQAGSFVDARVAQQWDGERISGKLVAKTLSLKENAWDVYLLYAPGVRWTGEAPPAPTFWTHQLRAETGADQRACLNPAVFAGKVANLLGAMKGGV
jgi:copper chaperone CopZ